MAGRLTHKDHKGGSGIFVRYLIVKLAHRQLTTTFISSLCEILLLFYYVL